MLVFRCAFCCVLLFSGFMSAQNSFFFPFGTKMSALKTSLETRNYYKQIEVQKAKSHLIAYYENSVIFYRFDDSVLYEVEMYKTVEKKAEYKKLVTDCKEYIKGFSGDFIPIASEGNFLRCAQITDTELFEIKGESELKTFNVYLKKTSRNHGPRFETEAYVMQIKGKEDHSEKEGSEQ